MSYRVYLASEFLGTAALMIFGCCGYANPDQPQLGPFVLGSMSMFVVYCCGMYSGGHANTSVTLACYKMGYMSAKIALSYMTAQFLGALFGYYVLTFILPAKDVYDCSPPLCLTVPADGLEWTHIFGIECLLTFLLLLVWQVAWDRRSRSALYIVPLFIGIGVYTCAIYGQKYTGGSMNLARSLAPAIIHQNFDQLHVYAAAHLTAVSASCYFWSYLRECF